jgi:thiamine monophosphate synthase
MNVSNLPFRRLAITPPWPNFDSSTLLHWQNLAQIRGADAYLIRQSHWPGPDLLTSTELLKNAAPHATILVSVTAVPTYPLACGLHFKSGAAPPFQEVFEHGKIVGKACHTLAEVRQAASQGYTYALLSPIYPTRTHPEALPLGPDTLAAICRETPLPIIALGGISEARVPECYAAGAAAVAGISLFADPR